MIRKTLSLLLGLSVLLVPMAAADVLLEDVLSKHYEAIGGLDAWRALDSCRMSGRMIAPQGIDAPFTLTYQEPLKSRLEVTFQGMTRVQAFDGEVAWAIVPFSGSADPQEMPEEFVPMMKEQSDLPGPLVDWEAKGHQIDLVGRVSEGEVETIHLEVTLESGAIRHYFLDGETYLPSRIEATTEFMGNEVEVETVFSDFRQVGDLVMAHSIATGPIDAPEGQEMLIESIELDVELEDDYFSFPEPEAEEEPGGSAEEGEGTAKE